MILLLNLELIDQPPLLLRQFGQAGTRRTRLIRTARHFIGHLTDIDHVAVDVIRHGALLFSGTGDLRVHVIDHRHCLSNRLQRLGGFRRVLHAFVGAVLAVLHDPHHIAGALLQLLEDVLKKGGQMNPATLLHGKTLNMSEVASRVEKIVGDAADQDKVDNFEKEANRKQFGEAKQALNAFL